MKAIKQLRDVELKTCGYAPGYRTFNLVVEAADGSRYQLRLNKKDSRFLYHELEQMYKAAGPDPLD